MSKKHTFAPVILIIILLASLLGWSAHGQAQQQNVFKIKITDTTDIADSVVIKKIKVTDDGDGMSEITVDSLIQTYVNADGDEIKHVQVLKLSNGDTLVYFNSNDTTHHVTAAVQTDSLAQLLENLMHNEPFDFDFDFDHDFQIFDDSVFRKLLLMHNDSLFEFSFDDVLDPLNHIDIDWNTIDEETNDLEKNIEVIVNSDDDNDNPIFITRDGDKIKIERNGELVFINDDQVKNVQSIVQVTKDENGEQVIVLQTRIVLDELSKMEQKELKNKGLQTSKREPKYEYLKFYPNPSYGQFNIQFRLAERGDIEVKIVNMIGKTVFIEKQIDFTGEYNKSVDLTRFGKGNYILQIIQNDRVISRKIIVE